jgi:hypothetical protein
MFSVTAFRTLQILLGTVGAGLLLAMFAVLLPISWMSEAHRWLGLGDFPDGPITIYLARSTSLLYAVHGFFMLYVAIHLGQHFSLAKVFGYLHVAIGLTMLAIDLTTPMPWYWTLVEGVPIALTGAAIVWLARRAEYSRCDSPPPIQTSNPGQT